jgi:hypothetical protein
MRLSAFVFFSCLSCALLLAGCATDPTQQQQMVIDSGIRLSTMAYVLKDGDEAAQHARAMQVLAMTAQVRKQIDDAGKVVPDLSALAEWANAKILANESMSAEDKRLLRAAVLEAIFLAEDTGLVVADIGAKNAARVNLGLSQVDRVARTLIGLPA